MLPIQWLPLIVLVVVVVVVGWGWFTVKVTLPRRRERKAREVRERDEQLTRDIEDFDRRHRGDKR